MRAMAAPFFAESPFLLGPVFTLVLFFVVFIAVVFYVTRSKTLRFEGVSALPLADDRVAESAASGVTGTEGGVS